MAVVNRDFPFPSTLAAAGKLVYVFDKYGPEMRLGVRKRLANDELDECIKKYGEELLSCGPGGGLGAGIGARLLCSRDG